MIIGIVAVSENYAIGKDGKLPWHYPADLKFFKQTTTGNAIVMGANTWRSIGRPLPNRLSIILSRSAEIEVQPNVLLLRSTDELLALSQFLKGDLYIIGGAQTYKSLADFIDEWLVTRVPETVKDADVFMPESFLNGFTLRETTDLGDGLKVENFRREQS
jgi:dihydrofolate reductase